MIDVVVTDQTAGALAGLVAIAGVQQTEGAAERAIRFVADEAQQAIPRLLQALQAAGATVQSIAPYQPTFDEVFVRMIQRHQTTSAQEGRS